MAIPSPSDPSTSPQADPAPNDAAMLALMVECYNELRAIAASLMRDRTGQTLQPTAVVHEVFLKLARSAALSNKSSAALTDVVAAGAPDPARPTLDLARLSDDQREHFLALASRAMRQVLADAARRRSRLKRSPNAPRIELPLDAISVEGPRPTATFDVEAVDRALSELERADPRAASLVELRFFGGFSVERAANRLGISRSAAESDWRFARAWLVARLGPVALPGSDGLRSPAPPLGQAPTDPENDPTTTRHLPRQVEGALLGGSGPA